MQLASYEFEFLEEISPERNSNGQLRIYSPQQRYNEANSTYVHSHGWGPFCKFRLSMDRRGPEGVYALQTHDEVAYIGESTNINRRFNTGYGQISPRACFKGGQQTNCRINNNIVRTYRNGNSVNVYIHETDNRKSVEQELIRKLSPAWNLATGEIKTTSRKSQSEDSTQYTGKYQPLHEYFLTRDADLVEMTFTEIEEILGFDLPDSAYDYPAWWANTGESHSHARSWLEAGWESQNVNIEAEKVSFRRN